MVVVAIRLSDLEFLSRDPLLEGVSPSEVVKAIRRQFDYLAEDLDVEIHDGIVTLRFSEASETERSEAKRLFEKASRRAKNGEFEKARGIYARVLELDPTMAGARRDLAMTLFELGDISAAKDELIDALRLQPDDAWSYVVLANIYLKHDRDLATASRFLERALELKPGDPYALNSLAAISHELADTDKALRCFDEVIASHPEFANAWFGKALLFSKEDQPARSVEVLDEMFQRAELIDARSQAVFNEARRLCLSNRSTLAEAHLSDAFKVVETYKADIAELSGFSVKVGREVLPAQISGVAQMAWKHGRDHHLVKIKDSLPPPARNTLNYMNLRISG